MAGVGYCEHYTQAMSDLLSGRWWKARLQLVELVAALWPVEQGWLRPKVYVWVCVGKMRGVDAEASSVP